MLVGTACEPHMVVVLIMHLAMFNLGQDFAGQVDHMKTDTCHLPARHVESNLEFGVASHSLEDYNIISNVTFF